MAREIDTGICSTGEDGIYSISSDELKWVNRIRKLKEDHPGEVKILVEPEDNDGCIVAHFPAVWCRINPTKTITEEQRQAFIDRIHGGDSGGEQR